MVISLESQNVKIKRTIFLPSKRLNNVNFKKKKYKTPKLSFKYKIPNIFISIKHIPFIFGAFIFLVMFSNGYIFFIPKPNTVINLDTIVLPDHQPEVISKTMFDNYEILIGDSHFSEVRLYKGETLSSISVKYGISKETILNVNNITDIRDLSKLNTLIIPKSNGFNHKLTSRDTLESLSKKYDVLIKDIFRTNSLKSENLSGIDTLFIPGVDPVQWGWKSNINKFFIYPLNGYITKRYGFFTNSITGITSLYEGIDLIPSGDNKVFASKEGYISRIGLSVNYGHYIFVDHQGGIRTLYAHLDKIKVSLNDTVKQGDVIGLVGKSGFTNSSKLFFSIFKREETIDPEEYLK